MRTLFFTSMIMASFSGAFAPALAQTSTALKQTGVATDVKAQLFTNRLKAADAILTLKKGHVYALDTQRGQIAELQDRRLDGRADTIRILPQRFEAPTAMILHGGKLYVADKQAVWKLDPQGKTRIASLSQSQSNGHYHLAAGDTPQTLIVGLTRGETAILINVDIASGFASLRSKTKGTLLAAKRLPNGTLWTSVQTSSTTSRFSLELHGSGPQLQGVISDFTVMPKDSPWAGQLIAILEGNTLSRIPMDFGRPILSEQDTLHAVRAKTIPTNSIPLASVTSDPRGVFIFNRHDKTLWVMKPMPSLETNPKASLVSPRGKTPDP